jgi:hypothetical protein
MVLPATIMSLDISREERDLKIENCREKALARVVPLYITTRRRLPIGNQGGREEV